MTSSLVGSEMCIRDRGSIMLEQKRKDRMNYRQTDRHVEKWDNDEEYRSCLLYTSDAADDM
eukprot:7634420-Prorocentrum_lima.AAC.1